MSRAPVSLCVAALLLLAPTAAHAQSGTSDPFERGVASAYVLFNGRPPTIDEARFWETHLRRGAPRDVLTSALVAGPPWRERIVRDLYQDVLSRLPDPTGLSYWRDRITEGTGVVVAGLLGSPEAYQRAGGDPEAFVEAAYRTIFGRSADPGGLAHWSGRLRAGVTTAAVVRDLWGSQEARERRVASVYRDVLGRDPDRSGLLHWAGWLASGDELTLSAHLAASPEFWPGVPPDLLPFEFAGTRVLGVSTSGSQRFFVVGFVGGRPTPEQYCQAISTGLTAAGALVVTPCSPLSPVSTAVHQGLSVFVSSTDRQTFTVRIG